MSGHVGLDALGWDDRSVRIAGGAAEQLRSLKGPASVVAMPGRRDTLVAGEAAALAGAGRIAGCGERAALLRQGPDTEAGRLLWPAHLRWLAGEARRAVLAIPDCDAWKEARRQALIDAARRARLDPTLLWRSVATLLGLSAGAIPVPVSGGEAIVISLTASETTISRLGLEVDGVTGLLTPLRRRYGQLVSGDGARGLDMAEHAARELARHLDAASAAERLLWSTPTVADILAGRPAAAPDLLLADGRWLVEPVASFDVATLGERLVEAVRRALGALAPDSYVIVVVEGPFAACPAPGGSVGSSVLEAAAKLFPGASCRLAPPGTVATGAAEHARRLALGLPTYFDFLPQIEIAALVHDEPGFVPLIRGTNRIAGGGRYAEPVEADFSIAAGSQDFPIYLAMEGAPTVRALKVKLQPPPDAKVAVRLHVEQRPAQGHARVEIVPKGPEDRAALGRGGILLDWASLTETELDKEMALATLQTGYGCPDKPAYLPAHRALWALSVSLGARSVTPRDLLERFVRFRGAQAGTTEHLALVRSVRAFLTQKRDPSTIPKAGWRETGKHGPLDSDGDPPVDLPAAEKALLVQVRAELERLLGLAGLKPAFRSQLVLAGSWLYLAAPPAACADLRRQIQTGGLRATLAQAAGRCLTSEADLRAFYALLHQRRTEGKLGLPEIKAAAESLQWRPDAARALTAVLAQGLTLAALEAMRREREKRNFKQSYRWAQQLLFVLLRFRIVDRLYLGRRSPAWAPLRARVEQEVAACLDAVTARGRGDLAKALRDYRDYLDSRARDGGLIVDNDPYRSSDDEAEDEDGS
jgi:hypothetical protein